MIRITVGKDFGQHLNGHKIEYLKKEESEKNQHRNEVNCWR